MKVSSVTYGRLRITKPYENERVEVSVVLDEGESVDEAMSKARMLVMKELGLTPTPDAIKKAKQILKEAGEV